VSKLKDIVLEKDLNKKHWLYFNLVDFLSPLYSSVSSKNLQSLSFASYGYFRAMLIIDDIIDEPEAKKGSDVFKFLLLFESCIKELSFLFPANNLFWKSFENAKAVYFQAIKFEKTEWKELNDIAKGDFEKMAENKSASMCYPLIDALESLQNQGSNYSKPLKDFLKHLHIAFQYQDDLDDFKKDFLNNQRTYPQFLVNQSLKENNLIDILTSADLQYKFLFTSGIASLLLKNAIENYKVCLSIITELNLSAIAIFVQQELNHCEGQLNEIDLLIEKTKIKSRKSNSFRPLSDNINIENCISESISYLEKNIDKEELWTDFMTTAGTSKYWVTFYTAYQLAEAKIDLPILKNINQRISNSEIMGSYNETIPEDGDTLNFLVGFIMSYKKQPNTTALEKWISYTTQDGGWVTYQDEVVLRARLNLKNEISLKGWTSPKMCVSATACKVLSLLDVYEDKRKATEIYLLSNQNTEGYWDSYWWTSPIYATSWAVQALSENLEYHQHCAKACNWLLQKQLETGAWINPFTNEKSSLYTALAIKALLVHNPKKYATELKKAASWLIGQQTVDGSWQTSRILAIPATDVIDKSKVTNWRKSSFGVNIVVDDHNRIFTTATVANALEHYQKIKP
jgi:Squalene-hopene cyclase C-terminal domain/Polyprenyl synthetase